MADVIGVGHGIWWVVYHLWNPVLIGAGHGIWWVVYHLWNPVAVVPGRWLQRVAVALIAMGTVINILQTAIASLFISTIGNILKRNR